MEKVFMGIAQTIIETDDITKLSSEALDNLHIGDIVSKITGVQKHAYHVSYRGEGIGEGICLTYCACGYIETVSYDLKATGWEYNSTDVWQAQ